jgi:multicomponent Na+:H+ antiporter subunit F
VSLVDTVATVCFAALAVAAGLCLLRALRGPSLADRIISLDSLLIVIVSAIAVNAYRTGSGDFLDVLLVASLIAFIGTITVARFIEQRGAR